MKDWISDSPRGETLPINCTYPFSFGKRKPNETDLPEGWEMVWLVCVDPEIETYGFKPAPAYLIEVDGRPAVSSDPTGKPLRLAFLRDPNGMLVATWDEGRWWTPDESAAWRLMLKAPATYVVAEGLREQTLPRWMRRRKK